jgi:radical SAM-linked protein
MSGILPIKQRIYITFGKFEALIYTSNLDVAKMWERILRRADLPILYTEGFNPRPRIALASALPLGISSECELLDVSLREQILLEGLAERLLATSPSGLRIYHIQEVTPRSTALQSLVRSSEYVIQLEETVDRLSVQARIEKLLQAERVMLSKERNGKPIPYDVRPLIYSLSLTDNHLITHLAVGERGNLRPDEVLTLLDLQEQALHIHRTSLHLEPA